MAPVRTQDGPTSSIRFLQELEYNLECVVVAFNSELGGVSTASKDKCVFVSGDRHSVHMRDRLCFLLHMWMCTLMPPPLVPSGPER